MPMKTYSDDTELVETDMVMLFLGRVSEAINSAVLPTSRRRLLERR